MEVIFLWQANLQIRRNIAHYYSATADQILPLVKCELGLAFLPQPMAAPSLLKKEIVQIPLKDEIPERQICLVYDSQHPMGAAARELKNTILLIT